MSSRSTNQPKVKKNSNALRNNKIRIKAIKKNVGDAWEKDKNPYFFGGAPVLDQSGRIVTIDIQDLWLKYSRMNIYMINWLKQLGRIVFIKKDLGKTTSVNQEG